MRAQTLWRRLVLAGVIATSLATAASTSVDAGQRKRTGARCVDGTMSTATGSGACSHHGGVACWTYSDGTCTKP